MGFPCTCRRQHGYRCRHIRIEVDPLYLKNQNLDINLEDDSIVSITCSAKTQDIDFMNKLSIPNVSNDFAMLDKYGGYC